MEGNMIRSADGASIGAEPQRVVSKQGEFRGMLEPRSSVDRDDRAPLSPRQKRFWRLYQRNSTPCQTTVLLEMRGTLNEQALRAALNRILLRHEVLRTKFRNAGDRTVQVISGAETRFPLVEQKADRDWRLDEVSRREALNPIDISKELPIRGKLLRAGGEAVLLITIHQIASDRWSIDVLVRELIALYRSFVLGGSDPLPPPVLQYAEYDAWRAQQLSAEILESELKFWTSNLSGAAELAQLPINRPRPSIQLYTTERIQLNLVD